VFNPTRIANGEGDTLSTTVWDIELVRVTKKRGDGGGRDANANANANDDDDDDAFSLPLSRQAALLS
jgi:hypothetical protein